MDFDINDILNGPKRNDAQEYDRSFHIEGGGEEIEGPWGKMRTVNARPSQMGVGDMIRLAERIRADWPTVKVTQYEVGCGSGLLGRSLSVNGHIPLPSGAEIYMSGSFLNAEEYDRWAADVRAAIAESKPKAN